MRIVFGFANGIKKSAPVRFAGVDVGIVKDIKIFFDEETQQTRVMVEAWLKADAPIPDDSVIMINQLGLLGEKYIEIFPGLDREHFLKEDKVYAGKDPIPQEKIAEQISEMVGKLENAVEGFNQVVHNEKNQKSIETALEGLSHIVTNVKEGRGTVGRLFYDEGLYADLQALTADLKENPWKLLYRPKPKSRKSP